MGQRVNVDESGLHLSDLFKMIFNHFILIVIICIIALAIGIFISLSVEDKFNLNATYDIVHVDNAVFFKYGHRAYDLDHFIFILTSDDNIMEAYSNAGFEDLHYKLKNLKEKLSVWKDTATGFICVGMTKVPEHEITPFSNMINLLVENAARVYVDDIYSNALEVKDMILSNLEDASGIFDIVDGAEIVNDNVTSSALSRLYTCKDDLISINREIELLNVPVLVHKVPTRSFDKVNTSNSIICIVAVFIGACIGVCIAFGIDLRDDHIYGSRRFNSGKLMGVIPLYVNSAVIDSREFEFFKSSLKAYDSIQVTSILEHAGRKTIAKGLEPLNVSVGKSLIENPSALVDMKSYDFNLIVLRNGIDEVRNIVNLCDKLESLEIENYAFLLNGVDVRDRAVTVYGKKSDYRRFKWLSTSMRKFYSKYYMKA